MVIREETVLHSWARDLSTIAITLACVGIGVYAESSAMQWFGAVIAFITVFVRAYGVKKANSFDVAGARKRLDEIEAIIAQEGGKP